MKFTPTIIPDVILVEPQVFGDERGFFMETWKKSVFASAGIDYDFVQDNHSSSMAGTLRGLHYQIHQPQGKLVRVSLGEIYDIAVDLRKTSSTFGHWVGVYLSDENKSLLWVPPGFAHGFYVTSNKAEVQYKCTDYYAPAHERCIRWDDPDININWPLNTDVALRLSARDRQGSDLMSAELFP